MQFGILHYSVPGRILGTAPGSALDPSIGGSVGRPQFRVHPDVVVGLPVFLRQALPLHLHTGGAVIAPAHGFYGAI